jgi:radical SAM superfamily enzyme YgiQ (UPF0313 family)
MDITKYQSSSFLNFTAPPLGLAYIAAVLEQNGYSNVRILDCKAFAMTFDSYEQYLRKFKPDVVGIQVLTPGFVEAIKTAEISKKIRQSSSIWGISSHSNAS